MTGVDYGVDASFPTLKNEHRLKVCENTAPWGVL
jgi:hypothetical protein